MNASSVDYLLISILPQLGHRDHSETDTKYANIWQNRIDCNHFFHYLVSLYCCRKIKLQTLVLKVILSFFAPTQEHRNKLVLFINLYSHVKITPSQTAALQKQCVEARHLHALLFWQHKSIHSIKYIRSSETSFRCFPQEC